MLELIGASLVVTLFISLSRLLFRTGYYTLSIFYHNCLVRALLQFSSSLYLKMMLNREPTMKLAAQDSYNPMGTRKDEDKIKT